MKSVGFRVRGAAAKVFISIIERVVIVIPVITVVIVILLVIVLAPGSGVNSGPKLGA